MSQRHLDSRLFEKLLRGDITVEEVRNLAWHLVETCPECAQGVDVDWLVSLPAEDAPEPSVVEDSRDIASVERAAVAEDGSSAAQTSNSLDQMFDRLTVRVRDAIPNVERDRVKAPVVVAELLDHAPARQRLLALNNSRYQTLPVVELLLENAWERGFDEPREADALADLALEIVDRIDSPYASEQILADVRARAWGLRGNFHRRLANVRDAESAFAKAHDYLAQGTGDLIEQARILTLESTLLRLQLRYDEAETMLDKVIRIHRLLGEQHLVGRTMINQALLLDEKGQSEAAIRVLHEAQTLIDPAREPHLLRVIQHNMVSYLSQLGRYEEAMSLIPALRLRLIQDGSRADLLRLRWQEGRIHVGLGNDSRAEAALLEVRKGMEELDFPHDVAVVSLELAALYVRQARTEEIRELAAQMFPIFQSRDLHQEAIAALLLFQRAVEMDTLTLRMVEEVADVVRRSQEKPRPRTPEPS